MADVTYCWDGPEGQPVGPMPSHIVVALLESGVLPETTPLRDESGHPCGHAGDLWRDDPTSSPSFDLPVLSPSRAPLAPSFAPPPSVDVPILAPAPPSVDVPILAPSLAPRPPPPGPLDVPMTPPPPTSAALPVLVPSATPPPLPPAEPDSPSPPVEAKPKGRKRRKKRKRRAAKSAAAPPAEFDGQWMDADAIGVDFDETAAPASGPLQDLIREALELVNAGRFAQAQELLLRDFAALQTHCGAMATLAYCRFRLASDPAAKGEQLEVVNDLLEEEHADGFLAHAFAARMHLALGEPGIAEAQMQVCLRLAERGFGAQTILADLRTAFAAARSSGPRSAAPADAPSEPAPSAPASDPPALRYAPVLLGVGLLGAGTALDLGLVMSGLLGGLGVLVGVLVLRARANQRA